jgi:deoxycytidylate deaminase
VTRYPCEACARAIVAAGIKHVVYAGKEQISQQTEEIFTRSSTEVTHVVLDWGDNNDR